MKRSFNIILKISILFFPLFLNCLTYSDREKKLLKEIRCVVCISQSIYESNADEAKNLRKIVLSQIENGKSDREIKDYLRSRFGEDVILSPPFNKNTLILWLSPIFIIVIGFMIIIKSIKSIKS